MRLEEITTQIEAEAMELDLESDRYWDIMAIVRSIRGGWLMSAAEKLAAAGMTDHAAHLYEYLEA